MKKNFLFICLTLIIASILAISAVAYDCFDLAPEAQGLIPDAGSNKYVKYYDVSFENGFAAGKDIGAVVDTEMKNIYYMQVTPEGKADRNFISCSVFDSQHLKKGDGSQIYAAEAFAAYANEEYAKSLLNGSAEVEDIICLSNGGGLDESGNQLITWGVYYKTSDGDYILYSENAKKGGCYLFPVDDFVRVQKEYRAYMLEKYPPYNENGEPLYYGSAYVKLSRAVNIAPYRVGGFNVLWIVIPAAVFLLSAAVFTAVMAIRRKKNRTESRIPQ